MRILCYGDSNTYGYDPRSFLGDRYPAAHRWTDLFAPTHTVLNAGENGRAVPCRPRELDILHVLLKRHAPVDLIIIMLGTNDLLQGHAPETVCGHMETLLNRLSDVSVLLLAPPPMQRGEWVEHDRLVEASQRLSPLYRELADRLGILFADAGSWHPELTFDGVHLSETGHAALASGLAAYLTQKELL